jgi:AcrR family transcriptional regulator
MTDVGLRARKKVETRQAIADAALALALDRGPAAITVDDIAAAAGVSTRTVFNYFATKEAAILGVDPQRRQDLVDRLAARPADEPPLDALHETLRGRDQDAAIAWRTRARLAQQHPSLQSAYLAGFTAIADELAEVIARRLPPEVAAGPYPRLVVIVALTAMRVAVDDAVTAGSDIPGAIDDAFAAVARGLTPPAP